MKKASILPALLLAGFTSNVSGAGFAIAEQSVKGLGSAFSGGAASADDASTVWYNPAGMTRFSGTHVSQAIHGIFPKAKYNDSGSIINPGLTGGAIVPLTGRDFDGGKDAIVPNFYMTHSLSDRLVVGLGMNAPFGLVIDYDSDWIGRYHALRSDVATVNINPSVAFKVNDQFSVGFGVSAQYIDVKLSQAIDLSAGCLAALGPATCSNATAVGAVLVTPGNPATDAQTRVEGDDWSWGFNFGFMYEPTEGTRLGIHYRSRVIHKLTGAAEFFYSSPGTMAFGTSPAVGLVNQTITADLDLPESISISAFRQVNDQWSVQTDLTWMKWSRFDELRIDFANANRPDSVVEEQWENTLRLAIGTTYKLNNKISLRGGVALDQTPISNEELRTPRIADADRVWVAVGGSYSLSDSASVDIGYTHIFVEEPDIDYITNFPATPHAVDSSLLRGAYDASVDIVSVQFNMEF